MLYLDNSATTQVHPEVFQAMRPFLEEEYGNPSSKYYSLAENAKRAVNKAREHVARLLGCSPDEVVFTSGATESNNFIIKGVADFYRDQGRHIITSSVEHPSVLETCRYLAERGYKITFLDVDRYGRISLAELEEKIKEDPPILVSILWGNNEIGSLNDIEGIAELCDRYHVFFHTDATQVVGKIPINLNEHRGIRFLSCSAHKLHGPKGVGAAVIRKHPDGFKTKLTPLLHGGGQENEYRSGTLAVHNIVGFGKAAEIAYENLEENRAHLQELEDMCKEILEEKLGDLMVYNNDQDNKIPGILSIQLKGINNEMFIKKAAPYIAVSTGSACSSGQPSHVLQAIGLSMEEVRSTIRISLSPMTRREELEILREL